MAALQLNGLNGLEILFELCSKTWECSWSKTDIIMMALHTNLVNSGYKCLCLGEDIPSSKVAETLESSELLPDEWFANQDCYRLIYQCNSLNSQAKHLIIKCIPFSTKFTINCLSKPDDKIMSLTVEISGIFNESYDCFKNIFKDKINLQKQLHMEINSKLNQNSIEVQESEDFFRVTKPIANVSKPGKDNHDGYTWEPRGMVGGYRDLDPTGGVRPHGAFLPRYDPLDPFDMGGGRRYDVNPDHFQPSPFPNMYQFD